VDRVHAASGSRVPLGVQPVLWRSDADAAFGGVDPCWDSAWYRNQASPAARENRLPDAALFRRVAVLDDHSEGAEAVLRDSCRFEEGNQEPSRPLARDPEKAAGAVGNSVRCPPDRSALVCVG